MYGDDPAYLANRRLAYIEALELLLETYGSERIVIITRAPGGVNLMRRHVEHRGGNVNVISINKEAICVASARDDNEFLLSNVSGRFEDRRFDLGDYLSMLE